MDSANNKEKQQLATACGTSVAYLRHLARGHGNRVPSVLLSLDIEKTTKAMCKVNRKLPVVSCYDLAHMCLARKGSLS
jgi:hypothetical protein